MSFDKGLDFSKIQSFSSEDGIVWKDSYNNSQVKKYNKSKKKSSAVSSVVKQTLVLAMQCRRDYDGALELLSNKNLGTVKESYWDMAKRVGSYGDAALSSWVIVSKPIGFYKENYS